MIKDFKFDLQNHGGVTKFLGGLVGGLLGSKKESAQPAQTAVAPAQPASNAPAPSPTSDSTTSTNDTLKKRAKGKANLTISSGSSSGGTGLNV